MNAVSLVTTAAGLAAGALVGWLALAAGPEPVAAARGNTPDHHAMPREGSAARPVLQLPGDCDGRRAALEAEVARLEAELRTTELTARVIEARRVEREGLPQSWPDDADPRLRPDAFEAALAEACASTGVAELHDVDCAEYPCVATLVLEESTIDGVSLDEYAPVFEALGFEDFDVVTGTASAVSQGGELLKLATVVLGPEGLPPEVRHRAGFRVSKAVEYARGELEAE